MVSLKRFLSKTLIALSALFASVPIYASEADLKIPDLNPAQTSYLYIGLLVCLLGIGFGLWRFIKVKSLSVHSSMAESAQIIYETCKTYLIQQGKFLVFLQLFVGACIFYYFTFLQHTGFGGVTLILAWSVIGILGSYSVAWFGIRMNTLANGRMAFASLEKKPIKLFSIPMDAGISIGVLLVCVELIMMLIILLFVPREYAGSCFVGFAIGESLGASALRIAGGIFTKIADIGSDLMKIVFKLKEDDPRNPGVIADCTGDNAGDSVGPTADGFETYGVTGVALITFIVLAIIPETAAKHFPNILPQAAAQLLQAELLTWLFVVRIVMVIASILSYWINKVYTNFKYGDSENLDFESALTSLVRITSVMSIFLTFVVTYWQLQHLPLGLWWKLSIIISCGSLGAALIPELTKVFTSVKAKHTMEVVEASREGGASLTVLSGIVAGNFSAFWIGLVIALLMFLAYVTSLYGIGELMIYPSIFAFGLVAFGFLGMGPVNIAVDSYGPVTDNAQSIYELSMIESIPGISEEIKRDYGFTPDFEKSKEYLEENDGAGNTFKATAKPVLIGTAVVGATTMIFSLILVLQKSLGVRPEEILNILNPYSLLGLICGGMVIYWFTGASMQAVTTGAYRAVEFIKKNINLDGNISKEQSTENSKEVVKICTLYAQKGMYNIFFAVFSFALAFAFFSASTKANPAPAAFFIFYLVSIAVFGLFQAIYMANAGGCWDNAKKYCEVNLKEKGTPLHDATVIGDTIGDPFKDTSSVALNPIIKFTTLFGLLAMEIAIAPDFVEIAPYIGIVFFGVALYFVWASFYKMRIKSGA